MAAFVEWPQIHGAGIIKIVNLNDGIVHTVAGPEK